MMQLRRLGLGIFCEIFESGIQFTVFVTSNNYLSARLAITPLNALWPLAAILSNNWKPREITTYAATSHILRVGFAFDAPK
jgi:hypothetical protein